MNYGTEVSLCLMQLYREYIFHLFYSSKRVNLRLYGKGIMIKFSLQVVKMIDVLLNHPQNILVR